MAWCYFSLKHYERALESFDHAERLLPGSYEVHKGRAFTYLEQKRQELAKQELLRLPESVLHLR